MTPSVRHAMEQEGQAVSSGSISRMLKVAFLDQNSHSGRKKKKGWLKFTTTTITKKSKQGRHCKRNKIFIFRNSISLMFLNIKRLQAVMGDDLLKNSWKIERPFSHKMKGSSTVCEITHCSTSLSLQKTLPNSWPKGAFLQIYQLLLISYPDLC